MTRNVAIILSGGSGSRMECDIPKQYLKIHGKMIISYSLECFVCNKHIDGLIIAIDPKWKRILEDETNSFDIPIHLIKTYGAWRNRKLIGFYLRLCETLFTRFKGGRNVLCPI